MRSSAWTWGLSLLACVTVGCGASADDTEASSTADTGGGTGGVASGSGGAKATGGGSGKATDGGAGAKGVGGATGTGGANAAGGSAGGTAGTGGSGGGPTHVVGACDGLGAVGQWEDITPPPIVPLLGKGNTGGGTSRFAVDPVNAGTVYLGTAGLGIWKTTDCGATWVHINTGTNSPLCGGQYYEGPCSLDLDTGVQWNFEIDPADPQVLYASNGYGKYTSGELKSTNGGVDWDEIWPKNSGIADANGFSYGVTIDPADHLHLLLTFHERPGLAESKDGGASWSMIPNWNGDGVWMLDSTIWLATVADTGGPTTWRTSDSGATWTQLSSVGSDSHAAGFLYRAGNGTYYLGAGQGVIRSTDGITWSAMANTGPNVKGVIGDGTTLYASKFGVPWKAGDNLQPYETSKETDGTQWTAMPSPPMTQGSDRLGYDLDHHVLYSSQCQTGFWRVKTR